MTTQGYEPPEHQDNSWMGCVFQVGLILAVLMVITFPSCSPRIVEHIVTEYRDTTIYQKEVHDSLVYVPIPLESNQVIAHLGDTSKLETSVARSEAFVGGDGFLHHSLENKREKLPVVVPVTSTIVYSGVTSNQTQTLTKIEYRDKPLTWWQRFRLGAFWWLVGGLLLCLVWIFRKFIFKFII